MYLTHKKLLNSGHLHVFVFSHRKVSVLYSHRVGSSVISKFTPNSSAGRKLSLLTTGGPLVTTDLRTLRKTKQKSDNTKGFSLKYGDATKAPV